MDLQITPSVQDSRSYKGWNWTDSINLATNLNKGMEEQFQNALASQEKIRAFKSNYLTSEQAKARIRVQLSLLSDASGTPRYPGSMDGKNTEVEAIIDSLTKGQDVFSVAQLDKYIEDIKSRSGALGEGTFTASYSKKEEMPASIQNFWTTPGQYRVTSSFGTPTNAIWVGPLKAGEEVATKLKPNEATIKTMEDAIAVVNLRIKMANEFKKVYQRLPYDIAKKATMGGAGKAVQPLYEYFNDKYIRDHAKDMPGLGTWSATYNALLNRTVKYITGAQMSEVEVARIIGELPQLTHGNQFTTEMKSMLDDIAEQLTGVLARFEFPVETAENINGIITSAKRAAKRFPFSEASPDRAPGRGTAPNFSIRGK